MTTNPGIIHSPRLDLIPMSQSFLEACLNGDITRAAALLGMPVPAEWLRKQWLIQRRLDQLQQDPNYLTWIVRAIILRQSQTMIGYIGFHTAPSPTYLQTIAPHGVEFGYTIYPAYRRQGYATEASIALMQWAREEHQVRQFVLSISPINIPSLRIAKRLGFHKVGSHIDEEDGSEDIFLLEIA